MHSRRRFLRSAALAAGASWLDLSVVTRVAAEAACPELNPAGTLEGLVPLTGDRPARTPFGELVGGPGLDARQFTDLSTLDAGRLVTPTAKVFVRTAAPPSLGSMAQPWSIEVSGGVAQPIRLGIGDLNAESRPMGPHLIECSGNNDPNNFGLMSVAEWSGVPLASVVSRLGATSGSTGVLVAGLDDEASASWGSVPGASWVLPLDDLDRLGAFLATGMNGEPLTQDHGAPVRLVVPGWYGCSWIKWVREIRLVGPDEWATSQMIEFARRTHQTGTPALVRDYEPPVIDFAATPVRVERRRVNDRVEYRVVGIAWGGSRADAPIEIRFGARDDWKKVDLCPSPGAPRLWSLWSCRWQPAQPGTYNITLRCPDQTVRTRRLELLFYMRRVRIEPV